MSVTMKDIAREAEVSHQAVSAVLTGNSNTRVSEAKRQKISTIAQKLGYRRNELAATTRSGVSRTVALIGDFESIPIFMNKVISGVLMSATKHDYGVRVYSPLHLNQCLNEIISYKVKHVIVVSLNIECRKCVADFCKKHDLKLVYVFEESCGFYPAVNSTDKIGIKNAVKYLVEQGHRRISLICAEHNLHYMKERHQGYLEGLKEAKLSLDERLIDCHCEFNESSSAIDAMLKLPRLQRPTAFICISDPLALQVEGLAIKNGFKVPEDISVIGFGDSYFCKNTIPPLTSVAQSFERMGETALKLVVGQDCGIKPNSKNEYLLDTKLINRESVSICKNNK